MIIIYPPITHRNPVRKFGNKITPGDNIALEIFTLTGEVTHESEITTHPVEEGIDINDNTRRLPITGNFECVVPDDPGVYSLIGDRRIIESEKFSQVIWEYLLRLKNESVVFELATKYGYYKNMLIKSLRPTETIETGNTIQFMMDVLEVRRVNSMSGIYYEPVNENVAKQMQKKTPTGKGSVEDIENEDTELNVNETFAAEIYRNRGI